MLLVEVELLQGTYEASDPLVGRSEPEWPPHPARLFAALVAGAYAAGMDADLRVGLEWLERQPAPSVAVGAASKRQEATFYVPVNDQYEPMRHAPGRPLRQPRRFPRTTPAVPVVQFLWADADPPREVLAALRRSAASVPCFGRSTAMAPVTVSDEGRARPGLRRYDPIPERAPAVVQTARRCRVPEPGLLAALEARHHDRRLAVRPSVRPYALASAAPPEGDAPVARGPFDRLLAFRRLSGPRVPSELTLRVTTAFRRALLDRAGEPEPPILHGRDEGKGPVPHCAYLALPYVGAQHADGRLLGVAVAVPRVPDDALVPLARAVTGGAGATHGEPLRFEAPRLGAWEVERVLDDEPFTPTGRVGLRPGRWACPEGSRRWRSVTPVVLYHLPERDDFEATVHDVVARSCEVAGYPRPATVDHTRAPTLPGVPSSRAFHVRRRPEDPVRVALHVELRFDAPVAGPLLVGVNRFLGLGLCLPLPEAGEEPNDGA